jgi:hypothetical protein
MVYVQRKEEKVLVRRQGDQMSLLKITQNVAQPVFCPNYYITFSAEKMGNFCNVKENCPKKTTAQ